MPLFRHQKTRLVAEKQETEGEGKKRYLEISNLPRVSSEVILSLSLPPFSFLIGRGLWTTTTTVPFPRRRNDSVQSRSGIKQKQSSNNEQNRGGREGGRKFAPCDTFLTILVKLEAQSFGGLGGHHELKYLDEEGKKGKKKRGGGREKTKIKRGREVAMSIW